jgi:hypothetical protein
VLATPASARDPTVHRGALADIVVELTRSGRGDGFLEAPRLAEAGFVRGSRPAAA